MPSGDGWLVRVKPTAATLSADAARLIASGARRHGNGHIDLTSRANLQVRGLGPRSSELFAETIIGAGLGCADPSVEAIRNVMAGPLGADDPSAAFDAHAVAREIEAMLRAETALAALPDKFGVAVDAGGLLPLAGVGADIMLGAAGDSLTVQLDGGMLAALCPRASLVETVKALALASLHLAIERGEPPRRMRPLVRDVSEDAIFEAAGLSPAPAPLPPPAPAPSAVGFIPYQMGNQGAFGAGLPFGRIDAEQLAALAALSERCGDGSLRTTPWRAFLIANVAAADGNTLSEEVAALGLITDPSDPRLRILACVGAPSCTSATVDARADATRLAVIVGEHAGDTIHVSGCAKSCAHRGPASLTLVGRDGRYDVIRNGMASDRPSLTGLRIDDIAALAGIAQEPVP
jgi:precorrin-3B synthase